MTGSGHGGTASVVTVAAVVAALFGVVLFGYWAGRPTGLGLAGGPGAWDDLSALFDSEDPAQSATDNITLSECFDACEHVVECGLVPTLDLCLDWCVDEWTPHTRVCAALTECDRIDERCFEKTEEQVCAQVCDHVAECDWMVLTPAECSEQCLEGWSDEERDCVLRSDCDSAAEHCLNLIEQTPCPQVCDKMSLCGSIGDGEFSECVEMCESEMDEPMRECLMTYDCDEMESVCVEGAMPEELCLEACQRAADCGFADEGAVDCLDACAEEWTDELALCLAYSLDCDEGAECFADPGVQCPELCAVLADCGQVDPLQYGVCVETCQVDFTEEERDCMMAADCASVDACLTPPPPPIEGCPEACAKMAECGALAAAQIPSCADSCAAAWNQDRVQCILDSVCESLSVDCLATLGMAL